MAQTSPLVVLAASLLSFSASAAQPLPANAKPNEPAQADTDFVLPPPHGSPKDLATGGTRGLAPHASPPARSVLDIHSPNGAGRQSGPVPPPTPRP